MWDLRTHTCVHTLRGHLGSVTCIGAQGWRLLSGGGYNRGSDDDEVISVDSTLRLWDLRKLGGDAIDAVDASAAAGGALGRPPACQPSKALAWTRSARSPSDDPPITGITGIAHDSAEPAGCPLLSLQLCERQALTSHGGREWTARIWDLDTEL